MVATRATPSAVCVSTIFGMTRLSRLSSGAFPGISRRGQPKRTAPTFARARNRTAELPNREFGTQMRQHSPNFALYSRLNRLSARLTRGTSATISESKISPEKQGTAWRRGRDSNPRYGYPYNGFRDRPVRPLRHLSEGSCSLPAGRRQPEGSRSGSQATRNRVSSRGVPGIDLYSSASILRRSRVHAARFARLRRRFFKPQNSDG